MPENEKKKLGPLSLRLVERLAGPALQVAKKIGIEKLSEAGGTQVLLDALQEHLLPLQKQAALELYHAGMREGILSRQHGESMSSYCLRRQAWWTQLQELDGGIQCSSNILGEQLLLHAGLGNLEQQMVRTGCQNGLSDLDKVSNILRDQFGSLHERESRGKGGKGRYDNGKNRYDNKPWYARTTGYYSSEAVDEKPIEETYHYAEDTTHDAAGHYEDDEHYYQDEDWIPEEDGREREIEEEVIAWYSTQNVDSQTCSPEDLEMVIEAVEVELAAYYSRMNAEQRGVSMPSHGNPYGGVTMPQHDRQAKVMAAKQRSRCRSCGQMGHWQRDPICPNRGKGKSKGHGKRFGGSKSKFGGKKGDNYGKDGSPKGGKSPSKGDKPRVVYFALNDADESGGAGYMAYRGSGEMPEGAGDLQGHIEPEHLDQERQRAMEREVQRLMALPPERIDEMLQQELAYMPPTSKSASVRHAYLGESPPQAVAKQPMMKPPPPKSHMIYRSEGAMPGEGGLDGPTPRSSISEGCEHKNITRRGTNAYISMETCKDCGKILRKEPKTTTANDKVMTSSVPGECDHPTTMVNWKGTNGYAWKWTCEKCGMTETHKKEAGLKKPIPGQRPERDSGEAASSTSARSATTTRPRMGDGGSLEEILCGSQQDWQQFSGLLHRMVENHIALHGSVTQGEFYHIASATYATTLWEAPLYGRWNLWKDQCRGLQVEDRLRRHRLRGR